MGITWFEVVLITKKCSWGKKIIWKLKTAKEKIKELNDALKKVSEFSVEGKRRLKLKKWLGLDLSRSSVWESICLNDNGSHWTVQKVSVRLCGQKRIYPGSPTSHRRKICSKGMEAMNFEVQRESGEPKEVIRTSPCNAESDWMLRR